MRRLFDRRLFPFSGLPGYVELEENSAEASSTLNGLILSDSPSLLGTDRIAVPCSVPKVSAFALKENEKQILVEHPLTPERGR